MAQEKAESIKETELDMNKLDKVSGGVDSLEQKEEHSKFLANQRNQIYKSINDANDPSIIAANYPSVIAKEIIQ